MANLSSVLQGIPGLRGWQAQDQFRQEQMQGDQATQLNQMKLAELFNGMQEKKQFGEMIKSADGDLTKIMPLAMKAAPTNAAAQEFVTKNLPIMKYQEEQQKAQQAQTLGNTLGFIQEESAPQDIQRQTQSAIMQQGAPTDRSAVIKQMVTPPTKTKWNVVERYNEKTGMPEKVFVNENDPTDIHPFGGQKSEKASGGVKVTNNVGDAEGKYAEEAAKAQVGEITQLGKEAAAAYKSNKDLDTFIANSANAPEGALANITTQAMNLGASLGFSSDELTSATLMKQAIGKNKATYMAALGARGLTDRDMEVLAESLPMLNTSVEARNSVAGIVKKSNEAILKDYDYAIEQEGINQPISAKMRIRPRWYGEWKSGQQPAQQPAQQNPLSVTTPDGKTINFKSPQAAAAFRKKAGL